MTKQQGFNQKMKKRLASNKRFARNKLSSAVLGLTTALLANGVAALGLGEIDLNSALDQNLEAEIKLLEVRDLSKAEILVGLAEQAAFDRQGVERAYFLTNIKFEVDLNARGGPVVRLTSDQPVREPFIDFIVEARWPSGKLLREYTVLLDLPVYAEDTPAPVAPVQTETVVSSNSSQSSAPSSRAQRSNSGSNTYNNPRSSFDEGRSSSRGSTTSTYTPSYTGDSYRVQSNDTLWEIALDVRPDSSVSVHQTMIALHRANPEAFINGNINLLKSGKVLRVPEQDEIRSLNKGDAVRQVAQHNQDWSGGDKAAPLEASNASLSSREEEAGGEGRLSLVSPEDSFDAQAGRVSGGNSASSSDSEALKSELAATQETLDKTRGENQDLQSKINSLEDQIRTLESMIEISNESLRAMELAAASGDVPENLDSEGQAETSDETSEDQGLATDYGAETESELVPSDADSEDDSVTEMQDDSVADSEGAATETPADTSAEVAANEAAANKVAETKAERDPSKVVYSAPKKETGLFDLIKEYFLFIGLGILALGAGIYFFFKKRKDEEEFDDFLDPDFEYEEPETEVESEEELEETAVFASEADDEQSEETELVEDSSDADELAEPETEDVVAESDIYIAYGKYDQAEEMLVKALNVEPEHHEARLKLLEIYSTQGNIDSFDPNYAALISGGASSSLVGRAELLRENISDAPPFDESMYQTGQFDTQDDSLSGDSDLENSLSEDLSEDLDLDLGEEESFDTELNLDAIDLDDTDLSIEETAEHKPSELGEFENSNDDDLSNDSIELADDESSSSDDDGSIEFDLDGLDFDSGDDVEETASSIEDDLNELEDIPVAEGIDIADEFDLSLEESSSEESDIDAPIEFDLGDLEENSALNDSSDLDISESELNAPSLQDELESDLGAIDFDLDGLEEVSEEIEADDVSNLDSIDQELAAEESVEASQTDESELNEESESEETVTALDIGGQSEEEDTLIRGSFDESFINEDSSNQESPVADSVDELSDVTSDLDLESLDAELDELSVDLDDVSLGQGEDEFASLDADLEDLDAEVDSKLGVIEEDLELEEVPEHEPSIDLSEDSSDRVDEDLDATLAEGEQILAELEEEVEVDEVSKDGEQEADLEDFDDLDLDSIGDATSLASAPSFEEFDIDEDSPTEQEESSGEESFDEFESFDADETADDTGDTEATEISDPKDESSDLDVDTLGFDLPDIDPEATDDTDLDFLSSSDEIATKLDLAAAYVDMGDASGAKEILEEVLAEGDDSHKAQANALLEKLND